MKHSEILTIILNYKTPEMTLESVAAARVAMANLGGEICIVDNDSQDGSFEEIQKHVESNNWGSAENKTPVRVLQSGHNGGFGAGNNYGIRAGFSDGSKPDMFYILNSDAFPAKDAIEKLAACLRTTPNAGFAGSYIHGPSGEAHITAFRYPSIASEFEGTAQFGLVSRLLGRFSVPLPMPKNTQTVDWLAGASMLMRREMLDEIGLFDEQFFLYFEETDLCRRAAKAGWQTIYVHDSAVAHIGSVSTGMQNWKRVPEYWYDSRLHYFTKNHGHIYAGLATLAHALGVTICRLKQIAKRDPATNSPYFLRNLLKHYFKSLAFGRYRNSGACHGPKNGPDHQNAANGTGG